MSRAIITASIHDANGHNLDRHITETDVTRIDVISHPPNPQVLINGSNVDDVQRGFRDGLSVTIEVDLPAGNERPTIWIDGKECAQGSSEWDQYIQPSEALMRISAIAANCLTVIVRFTGDGGDGDSEDVCANCGEEANGGGGYCWDCLNDLGLACCSKCSELLVCASCGCEHPLK